MKLVETDSYYILFADEWKSSLEQFCNLIPFIYESFNNTTETKRKDFMNFISGNNDGRKFWQQMLFYRHLKKVTALCFPSHSFPILLF